MTEAEASSLITNVVVDFRPRSRHPRGVFGAVVGGELAKRGARGLHKTFGFATLGDFVDRCCPDLIVRRGEEGVVDILIDLRPDAPSLGPAPDGVATHTAPLPQPQGRVFPVRASSVPTKIDSNVWCAVLGIGRQPPTFLNRSNGAVLCERTPPAEGTDGWVRVEEMPRPEQAEVVEAVRGGLQEIVRHEELRAVLLQAIDVAKTAPGPIGEFSRTIGAATHLWRYWNERRIEAVIKYIQRTTGIDLRVTRPQPVGRSVAGTGYAPVVAAAVQAPVGDARATGTAPDQPALAGLLRIQLKEAIDRLNLRHLLELRLHVEDMTAPRRDQGA